MTGLDSLMGAYTPFSLPISAPGGAGRAAEDIARSASLISGAFEKLLVSVRNTDRVLSDLTVGLAQFGADFDAWGPSARLIADDHLRAERDPVALERERLETVERTNRAYRDSRDQVAALADAHEEAEDKVSEEWGAFGETLATTFRDLFREIERDGKLSVSGIFDAVEPLVTDLFSMIAGADMSRFFGQIGSVIGGIESGRGVGLDQIFSLGRLLLAGIFPGGAEGRDAQTPEDDGGFAGLLRSLAKIFGDFGAPAAAEGGGSGGSDIANLASTAISVGSGFFASASGGGAGAALAGANPYIAAAMFALDVLGPTLFQRTPSVGPTTISRLLFPEGRDSQIGTADNGGDPDALDALTNDVFDAVDDARRRFGAEYRNFGLDIGYFSSPESGSGRESGYTLSTILDGVLGQNENIQGLSEPEVIEKAVFLTLKQGLQDFDSPEVGEAVRNSTAEDLGALLEDLDFADAFGRLRQAFQETGESIDAMTVALVRQRFESEEAGRDLAGDRFTEIFEGLERLFVLFDPDAAVSGYEANIDRLVDGIDVAQADIETFVGMLTGAFAPDQLGVFERRLLEGRAALAEFEEQMPALTDRLTALKDQFPELAEAVDAFLARTTESLGAASADLQQAIVDDFEAGVEADLRSANGLGILDSVTGLVEDIEARRRDGLAIGADVSGLDDLLSQQLENLFRSGTPTISGLEALGRTFAENATVMAVLNDTMSIGTSAANDNAAAQMTLAQVTALATQELGRQIREQEDLANASEQVIDQIGETRRRLLFNDLSILSPAEQLEQARLRFEDLSARARSGDPEAQGDLSEAGVEYLELARSFYASSEDYARIFEQVDGTLEATESIAQTQFRVAEEQLEVLREISRALTGEVGDLPDPDAGFGANPTRNRLIARITGYAGGFGDGGFGAFRSGLGPETNALVDILTNAISFADGGIMTGGGPLALKTHEQGGVAYGPQLTLFGEGRTAEAFVPLPDGRTIPVTMTQPVSEPRTAKDGLSERQTRGIETLVDETRRLRGEVSDMRSENAVLRRALERAVAGSRISGRVA